MWATIVRLMDDWCPAVREPARVLVARFAHPDLRSHLGALTTAELDELAKSLNSTPLSPNAEDPLSPSANGQSAGALSPLALTSEDAQAVWTATSTAQQHGNPASSPLLTRRWAAAQQDGGESREHPESQSPLDSPRTSYVVQLKGPPASPDLQSGTVPQPQGSPSKFSMGPPAPRSPRVPEDDRLVAGSPTLRRKGANGSPSSVLSSSKARGHKRTPSGGGLLDVRSLLVPGPPLTLWDTSRSDVAENDSLRNFATFVPVSPVATHRSRATDGPGAELANGLRHPPPSS